MLIKVYITALRRFRIFSNLFKFSTRRYNHYKWVNWYSGAKLPWKKVVIIFLQQKWLGLAVMGKYHSELLMLFKIAFLRKFKYSLIVAQRFYKFIYRETFHFVTSRDFGNNRSSASIACWPFRRGCKNEVTLNVTSSYE